MKVAVELDEMDIRKILAAYISNEYSITIVPDKLPIEVKSKQNYRSEWETADIRIKVTL